MSLLMLLLLLWTVLLLTRLDVLWLRMFRSGSSLLLTVDLLLRLLGLWSGSWNFDDDISWLTDNFGFEAFLWIGGVCDGSAEESNKS
jgi:hypothetical protein